MRDIAPSKPRDEGEQLTPDGCEGPTEEETDTHMRRVAEALAGAAVRAVMRRWAQQDDPHAGKTTEVGE